MQKYNAWDVEGTELSLSIGIWDFHDKKRKTIEDILDLADKAKYKNKINRTCLFWRSKGID